MFKRSPRPISLNNIFPGNNSFQAFEGQVSFKNANGKSCLRAQLHVCMLYPSIFYVLLRIEQNCFLDYSPWFNLNPLQ